MTPSPNPPIPFLKRINIRNFKSIAYCDVELGPLTILVGRNGSGKSNFLDAIRFVGECLRGPLSDAIDVRGGWKGLIHQPSDVTARLSIQLTLAISSDLEADYEFEISDDPKFGIYSIERESLKFRRFDGKVPPPGFERSQESDETDSALIKEYEELFDPTNGASGRETFDTREALKTIRALNMNHLNFREMRRPQIRSKDYLVDESGEKLAEVAYRVQESNPWLWERISGYLGAITPMVDGVKAESIGDDNYVHLKFRESTMGRGELPDDAPLLIRTFPAASMSDGTLRALATLVAINPLANGRNPVRLVGVEEPESGLHPAAAGVLMSALREAAESRQIVVTTQSDDLLDRYDPETDHLLVVEMRDGATDIGPPNPASREAIQDHLATPGELLRMDQFRPDWEDIERQIAESSPRSVEVEQ